MSLTTVLNSLLPDKTPADMSQTSDTDRTVHNDHMYHDHVFPYIMLGTAALLLLVGGFSVWAATAQLDGAVIAPAEFTVKSRRQTIQHLEGGVIDEILVGEGDKVNAGQVLLKFDRTVDQANFSVISNEWLQLQAQRVRLLAELSDKTDLNFELPTGVQFSGDRISAIHNGQRDLFNARLRSRKSEADIRRKRVEKLTEEIEATKRQKASNTKQVRIIEQELVTLQSLVRRKFVSRRRLLVQEREAERIRGTSEALNVNIVRARNSIDEVKLEGLQAQRRFKEQVSTELQSIEPRISQLSEQLVAAQQKLTRVEVRSPANGFVVDMKANTLGGVIRPGDTILDIVPEGEQLILEARVSTVDIDKIKTGFSARIQLAAFDQAVTPEAQGRVLSLSADRLKDDRTGESYYLARLIMDKKQPKQLADLTFVPGMPATVFIQTGSRTPFNYLLKPITDRLGRVFVDG